MTEPVPPRVKPLPADNAPPLYDAHALTEGGTLATIHLDGQVYTLRITRAGKLILTK
ncbi:MAG: hemin uptake protein HemP [Mangrovicoccus sp.]|nr:hemin uptake protein HemP [Mangrovicoccus sp.]